MSTYIIYKTTCLVNQKIYVGQHNTSADDGYLGSGFILELAIKKHGKENFVRETIEFCTSSNVDEKEVYWIDELDARNPNVGYNIAKGGEGGDTLSQHPRLNDIKEKLSKARKGKKFSEEHRKHISEGRKGKIKLSEETKEKLRQINLKREIKQEWIEKRRIKMFGKKHSEETKKKISEKLKNNQNGRKYEL